ncbi:hypothetical protein FA15DRAFT_644769 [Coprinopsis marcescibilis]|uniref:S-adenosyl-L-methionine dependent methyltransferase n=1 Tax=Coprinopsis marcescibilis TaxID=230819 RepID=A0A5C3KNF6_COPMA|nr:hypothetical protein FA15DRAFT_644769 [Coprinopsis marcescibilis]
MHARNPYKNGIDFRRLTGNYESLRTHIYLTNDGQCSLDFRDENAQRCCRELTKAILKCDFGVDLELPEDRLCPPVPNRLNYILWIQDIIAASRWSKSGPGTAERRIRGLDIGTGASAIYPLLACSLEGGWQMVGTELDHKSYEYAKRNVDMSDMSTRIQIREAGAEILGPLFDEREESFDFTMCNPPFYSSQTEIERLKGEKEGLPSQVCTGGELEMVYSGVASSDDDWERQGGEVAFVGRMVSESARVRERCRWFTSMLGRLSSVPKITAVLKCFEISNYIVTEFVQGRTRRWAIGWSFDSWRIPDDIGRLSHLPATHPMHSIQPHRTTLKYPVPVREQDGVSGRQAVHRQLLDILSHLGAVDERKLSAGASLSDQDGERTIVFKARENTWSRAARRKRKRADKTEAPVDGPHKRPKEGLGTALSEPPIAPASSVPTPATSPPVQLEASEETHWTLICATSIVVDKPELQQVSTDPNVQSDARDPLDDTERLCIEFQWVYGHDRSLFESFAGHVGRKVGTMVLA